MSSNKPKTEYRVGVGASSILMVLVILALTAVSLLSFRSARNAEVLAKRSSLMTAAYYQASASAQEQLATLDAALAEMLVSQTSPDVKAMKEQLGSLQLEELDVWQEDDLMAFSFVVDAEYDRQLKVEGLLPMTGTERYRLTHYQLMSSPMEDEGMTFELMGV